MCTYGDTPEVITTQWTICTRTLSLTYDTMAGVNICCVHICVHMCTHLCTHVYTSVYTYGDTSEVSTTQWTLCTRTLSTWYEEHHKYIFFAVLVVSFLF